MKLYEKYWLTLLFTFLRYLSFIMILSGIGFIIAGRIVSPWYYFGLAGWPLMIMLGWVNLKYIRILARNYNLVGSKIVSD